MVDYLANLGVGSTEQFSDDVSGVQSLVSGEKIKFKHMLPRFTSILSQLSGNALSRLNAITDSSSLKENEKNTLKNSVQTAIDQKKLTSPVLLNKDYYAAKEGFEKTLGSIEDVQRKIFLKHRLFMKNTSKIIRSTQMNNSTTNEGSMTSKKNYGEYKNQRRYGNTM
ncbi:MAG: hypothetical protein NZL83_03315 [Candidatus Absconditabacterales bacterium]|nr:hypothetical protein [Candidatus Absconditabacterales bacterium]